MSEAAATSPAQRWKPYPKYKDSGVQWLGEIPEHWETKRLKRIFEVFNGSTPRSEEPNYWDGEIPWVTPDDLGQLSSTLLFQPQRQITEAGYESCGTTLVPAGSLILSTRAPIGHLAIAGVDLCTNQGCRSLVFRAKSNKEFFYYQLLASRSELESWGEGSTFKELSKTKLEGIELVSPSLDEQAVIVGFLDRETAKIDGLIAKKERLIELLQEKRTALITQAVTKGLDPNVRMKDSGVDWLGEIPMHWEAVPIKRLGKIRYGLGEPPEYRTQGLPFIRATNVTRGKIIQEHLKFVDGRDVPWEREPLLRKDDLIVVRSGAYTGDSAIVPPEYDGAVAGYDMFIRPSNAYPKFIAWTLLTRFFLEAQIDLVKLRAAQPHLNAEELGECVVLMPRPEEQEKIAAFLDRETAKIDALIAKIREAIDRLKEYRTALISAAVTGKIDVRGGKD